MVTTSLGRRKGDAMTPDDLGYLDAEVDSRIVAERERRFPESTCTHCPSHLVCLTTPGRYLRECTGCKRKVLFCGDLDGDTIDYEGGYVLCACLLEDDEYDYNYLCTECEEKEEERTTRACTDLLKEWEEEDS